MSDSVKQLRLEVAKSNELFEKEASAFLHVPFQARFNMRDQMRLLNLVVWSERTKLPYRTVFRVLVKYWRGKFPMRRAEATSLGVRPATLAGPRSKEILDKYIEERFSAHENISSWKQTERDRIIALLNDDESIFLSNVTSDPLRLEAAYRRQIKEAQRQAESLSKQMRRRKYRDNPFI